MTKSDQLNEKFTVILANGEFPKRECILQYLQNAQRVICCDGAATALLEIGLQPAVIIGDIDSLPASLQAQFPERILRISEQESNDLAKALCYCLARGWKKLLILGATGKREDHTLGNISLLADFCLQAPELKIITDYGVFQAIQGPLRLPSQPGQQVSIFSLHPETAITSSGLRYPLNNSRLTRWWQATLNEATDRSFTLQFSGPGPLLLFLPFPEEKC